MARQPASKISGEFDRAPLVLVVDDQHENLDLCHEMLTSRGFRVIGASNGEEAIARAESDSPDAIVMDVAMPTMDGFLATRFLKGALRTRGIPIVILTASGFDAEHEATAAGCDAFLMKPCALEDLEGVLRACIKARAERPTPHDD